MEKNLKEVILKIVEGMAKPCYVAKGGRVWGFDLDWVLEEADGQAIKIYDCPADYWPDCEDDWPAPEWLVAEISSELIDFLNANRYLVEDAASAKAEGNFFGASALVRQYEELVEEELDYWHLDWAYAYSLGLIEDTTGCY